MRVFWLPRTWDHSGDDDRRPLRLRTRRRVYTLRADSKMGIARRGRGANRARYDSAWSRTILYGWDNVGDGDEWGGGRAGGGNLLSTVQEVERLSTTYRPAVCDLTHLTATSNINIGSTVNESSCYSTVLVYCKVTSWYPV